MSLSLGFIEIKPKAVTPLRLEHSRIKGWYFYVEMRKKIMATVKNTTRSIIAIAIAAATTLGIVAFYGVPTLSYAAVQSSTTTNGMMTRSNNNMSSSTTSSSANNKTFYLFTSEAAGVNETKLGFAGDVYSLQTMVVNKGDNVIIHFYNLEKNPSERHSFTIGSPYNINSDLAGGENATITFVVDHEGVFQYHCTHHPPEMIGQLLVLPSPATPR